MLNFCLPFLVPVVSTMFLYLNFFSTTCLQAGKDVSIRFGLWYVSLCVARFLVLGILVNSSWKSSLGQVSTALHKWCRSVTIQAFHQVLPVRSGQRGIHWPWGTLSRCWWRVWWCLPDVCVFFLSVGGKKMKTYKRQVKCKKCEMCVCKKLEWFTNWTFGIGRTCSIGKSLCIDIGALTSLIRKSKAWQSKP